jgi:ABC-type multidrug transport system fused ATPase/permease subunit
MDSQTELEMDRCLGKACHGKTMITIAHRLATVRKCDQILVLQHGVLIESGSHRELMTHNGLYSKLYHYQELE